MNNDSIAVERFVHKLTMTEPFWQDKNKALFADVSRFLHRNCLFSSDHEDAVLASPKRYRRK